MDGCLHLFYINQDAFGEQMHTKLLLCLIVRIQTKIYGEQIQDNRFMCLISRIRTKTCGEQIQDMCVLCLIARISYTIWHFLPLIQTESGHSIVLS